MRWFALPFTVVTMLILSLPVIAAPNAFVATFDGAPSAPEPFDGQQWDVAVQSRDVGSWYQLLPMDLIHGPGCEPPPAFHHDRSYEAAVYRCANHVMTGISGNGFGTVTLTPGALVDFSQGEAVVSWRMSTHMTTAYDWPELWVTPFDDQLVHPTARRQDLAKGPRRAVELVANQGRDGGFRWEARVHRDHVRSDAITRSRKGWGSFLDESMSRRDLVELRISRTHIKFGMPEHGFWWVDHDIADLGWDRGVVQLQHVSLSAALQDGGPNTWHWDDVHIEPAVPLTVVKADRRYVDGDSGSTVNFASPAPDGGLLRFSAMATDVQLSFDGGAWEAAQMPSQAERNGIDYSNYLHPVPAGATRVDVRASNSRAGRWIAKDFAVIAEGGEVPEPEPTEEPTPEPTPTPTPTPEPTEPPADPATACADGWTLDSSHVEDGVTFAVCAR